MNRFVLNETSYHGAGAIKAIPEEIKARGFKKVFLASDPDLIKFGITGKVTAVLDETGIAYTVYSDIKPNPTIENVQHGVSEFKKPVRTALSRSAAARRWTRLRLSALL